MNSYTNSLLVVASMMLLAACAVQNKPLEPRTESGGQIFLMVCASCHGENAQGNGPVAPFLKAQVPDLTRIALRRDGIFPPDEIYRIIDGQSDLLPHGPRNMPVWGYEFFGYDADDEVAHRRATEKIDLLVKYLQSIQRAD